MIPSTAMSFESTIRPNSNIEAMDVALLIDHQLFSTFYLMLKLLFITLKSRPMPNRTGIEILSDVFITAGINYYGSLFSDIQDCVVIKC